MLVGLAITVAPVVVFNPVAGDQMYELAPLAVNVADCPMHTAGADGVTLIAGDGITVIVTIAVSWQFVPFVPVTV